MGGLPFGPFGGATQKARPAQRTGLPGPSGATKRLIGRSEATRSPRPLIALLCLLGAAWCVGLPPSRLVGGGGPRGAGLGITSPGPDPLAALRAQRKISARQQAEVKMWAFSAGPGGVTS
jgi:hypothetical protein